MREGKGLSKRAPVRFSMLDKSLSSANELTTATMVEAASMAGSPLIRRLAQAVPSPKAAFPQVQAVLVLSRTPPGRRQALSAGAGVRPSWQIATFGR